MYRILTTIILLHIGFVSFSQRIITGRVVDKDTKTPLKDVTINVKDKNISTMTNHKGFFQITVDSLDVLMVSLQDYQTLTFNAPSTSNFQIGISKAPSSIYKGGMEAFYKFIGQKIRYPQSARISNKRGYTYVSFQIDSLGGIRNLNIVQDIGGGCGDAVVEVLTKMSGEFLPDTSNSTYILPVQFRIGRDNSEYPKLENIKNEKLLQEIIVTAFSR
jgi:hypothetical protein